jgi:hypothetical protein
MDLPGLVVFYQVPAFDSLANFSAKPFSVSIIAGYLSSKSRINGKGLGIDHRFVRFH